MSALKDDLGRAVNVATPVRRIVSLSPATTENIFSIGAGALVVGDTTACNYPPAATRLTHVGNFYQPVYERIRALKPNIVLVETATATRADMDTLQTRCGVPVFVMQSKTYDDVSRQILRLGLLTGHARGAQFVGKKMATRAEEVTRKVSGQPKPTVFIQVDTSALYAAGPGTFMDDLIRRAGGVNVVKGSAAFPQVSREFLLTAKPDFYFVTVPGGSPTSGVPKLDPALRGLPALTAGNVRFLDTDLVSRPTQRLGTGLSVLAGLLHPDASH